MLKLVAFFTVAIAALLPLSASANDGVGIVDESAVLRSRIDHLELPVEQLRASGTPDLAIDGLPSARRQATHQIPTTESWEPGSGIEHASFQTRHSTSDLRVAAPSVRLTGFFQADTGWIAQSGRNQLAVGDARAGAGFRRARLAATGNAAENVGYMLELDFAFAGRPSFMDVWGEVRDLDIVQNVRVGQYRQPIGLDGMTSVKELTFRERSLPFAFLPFRQISAMAHGANETDDLTWAVSVFRCPSDFFAGNAGDSGGYGAANRSTGLLVDNEESVLHIGGAYSFINPSTGVVEYRNQPEFFLTDTGVSAFVPPTGASITPFFVDTGAIATESVQLLAEEFAASSGPWHAHGELIYVFVNRTAGSTATFSGASIQAGYILTGEHRPYDRKNAVLGRIVPHESFGSNGGHGGWEVATRWSYLDLYDSGINGG